MKSKGSWETLNGFKQIECLLGTEGKVEAFFKIVFSGDYSFSEVTGFFNLFDFIAKS